MRFAGLERNLLFVYSQLGVSRMSKSTNKKSVEVDSLDALYRKRDDALARVVKVFEKSETADKDELNRALDALTVAHIAATFEWASGS